MRVEEANGERRDEDFCDGGLLLMLGGVGCCADPSAGVFAAVDN